MYVCMQHVNIDRQKDDVLMHTFTYMTIFLQKSLIFKCVKKDLVIERKKKVFIPRQLVSTETRLCHMFLWFGMSKSTPLAAQWAKMVVSPEKES